MNLVEYIRTVATKIEEAENAGSTEEAIRLITVLRDTLTDVIPKGE